MPIGWRKDMSQENRGSKADSADKCHRATNEDKDTMKDLALDLGGSLIVATYGFIKHDEILEKRNER